MSLLPSHNSVLREFFNLLEEIAVLLNGSMHNRHRRIYSNAPVVRSFKDGYVCKNDVHEACGCVWFWKRWSERWKFHGAPSDDPE